MLAVMRDVPIMLLKKEFVPSMVHHGQKSIAVMKDALIRHRMEEFVTDMVQRERNANMRDAQTKL